MAEKVQTDYHCWLLLLKVTIVSCRGNWNCSNIWHRLNVKIISSEIDNLEKILQRKYQPLLFPKRPIPISYFCLLFTVCWVCPPRKVNKILMNWVGFKLCSFHALLLTYYQYHVSWKKHIHCQTSPQPKVCHQEQTLFGFFAVFLKGFWKYPFFYHNSFTCHNGTTLSLLSIPIPVHIHLKLFLIVRLQVFDNFLR